MKLNVLRATIKGLGRNRLLVLGILIVGMVSFSIFFGLLFSRHRPSPANKMGELQAYRQRVDFVLFAPTSTARESVKPHSIKLDAGSHFLSYVSEVGSMQITVSMQPTPEGFVDVPQAFDKLVEKMNQYSVFESLNGKVYLTKPQELNGGQTAVMNAKGTLLFAKPIGDLTDDQWRSFFNQLDVVK